MRAYGRHKGTAPAIALLAGLIFAPPVLSAGRDAGGCPDLPRAEAVSLGWSAAGLRRVRQEAERLGSAALMIVTDGKVVFRYGNVSKSYRAHSIRKSLIHAVIGPGRTRGLVDLTASLEQIGIGDRRGLSAEERQARVIDLMEARSGIYLPAAGEIAAMRRDRPVRGSHGPGSHWYYNNWDFNALGTIVERAIGQTVFEAFDDWIARPICMQDFDPVRGRHHAFEGSEHRSYMFRISARDLARFGLLYLNDGIWRGRRVLPEDWTGHAAEPRSRTGRWGTKSGYGRLWWVTLRDYRRGSAPAIPVGTLTASGYGGQRLVILRELDTVVVHRIDTDGTGSRHIMGSTRFDAVLRLILAARA